MSADLLFPACQPRCVRKMGVGDGHILHVEECGPADGVPVLFLHGGPGAGCMAEHRQLFDPAVYRVVMIDQRGAGRSLPSGELEANTTLDLIADLDYVLAATLGGLALIVALFWLGAPIFRQLGNYNLLIFFVGGVAACVLAGVPIAFAFGLATVGYLGLATTTPMMVLIGRMDEGMSHLILLAVPLFVFLGLLIEMTGMAKAMVAFLASLPFP